MKLCPSAALAAAASLVSLSFAADVPTPFVTDANLTPWYISTNSPKAIHKARSTYVVFFGRDPTGTRDDTHLFMYGSNGFVTTVIPEPASAAIAACLAGLLLQRCKK